MIDPSGTDIATEYFLDDLPSAAIPASRLHNILLRFHTGRPLSALQKQFLEERELRALVGLSRGELGQNEFVLAAKAEQQTRIAESVAAELREQEKNRLWQEASDRKNARLFAAEERKRARRKLFNDFGLGYIEQEHFGRVRHILQQVTRGIAIPKEDLIWLGNEGYEYWTDKLRRAHHEILAETFAREWTKSGDRWKAVNACAQWRKAELPAKALSIAEEALVNGSSPKLRSALFTTSGGALRDMCRHQEALDRGMEAHGLSPDDYRPCTLLGAVCIEMHAYAEGAEWYEKAEARGASRNLVDREIRSILTAALPHERKAIRLALRTHDPDRFDWL